MGLGNPGARFAGTRHNAGADVVRLLAARHDGRLRSGKEQALLTEVRIEERRLALAFPQTYMNDSGRSVQLLVRRFGIEDLARLVVVHDELDLPLGRLKLKFGGGLAGHNGLRSIKAHLHDDGFGRVRIGIGKPPGPEQGVDHVLSKLSSAARTELELVEQEAADAVEMILRDGFDTAMNRYNART